jgi:nucleoside-diphosphate-sugar epimerase
VIGHIDSFGDYSEVEVGTGHSVSVAEMVKMLQAESGNIKTELRFGALETRAGEFTDSKADASFLTAIGWKPAYNLEEGIATLIDKEFQRTRI